MPRPRVTEQERRWIQLLHDRDQLTFHAIGRRLDRMPNTIEMHYKRDRKNPEIAYRPGMPPPPVERTLVLCRPAALRRRQVGKLIQEFDTVGLDLIRYDRTVVTNPVLADQCKADLLPERGAASANIVGEDRASGPVAVMIWEGIDAIAAAQNLIGLAFPGYAAHSEDAARRQITLWFGDPL